MKKYKLLFVLIAALGFSSCEVVNQLIPDVEDSISETFTIVIDSNTPIGESEDVFMDITEFDQYQQVSQYIQGYELNKVSFSIVEYDAPEDLYFSAEVTAFDSLETTAVTIADVEDENLFTLASDASEVEMTADEMGVDQLLSWLEDPGKFGLRVAYAYSDMDGNDYVFPDEYEGSFKVNLTIEFTIVTGL